MPRALCGLKSLILLFSSKGELLHFLEEETDEKAMDMEEVGRFSDEKAVGMICSIAKIKHCRQLQEFEAEERNKMIRELKKADLSFRQIERLTGIQRGVISRA